MKQNIKRTELGFIFASRIGAAIGFIQIVQTGQSLCKLLHVEVMHRRSIWRGTTTSKLVVRYDMKFNL